MKKILILAVLLIFISGCTRIELGEDKLIIKNKQEAEKSNSSLIKNIQEKIPDLESSLDTPEIVEKKIIDETDSVDFGDVV